MKLFSKTRPVQTVCCSIDCETLNGINEIARQLKRLADAWNGTEKSEKTEKTAEKVSIPNNGIQVVWSAEEDRKLLSIVNLIGPRWVKISETGILPGRTPAAMSARYNNVLKNRK